MIEGSQTALFSGRIRHKEGNAEHTANGIHLNPGQKHAALEPEASTKRYTDGIKVCMEWFWVI